VEFFDILGTAFPPPEAIKVKFYTAKRTHVPVGPAKFAMNRCNEMPMRVKNLIFGLRVNLIWIVCRYAASWITKTVFSTNGS